MENIKIVCDGLARTTRVLDESGKQIPGVIERIEIEPITGKSDCVRAKVTFVNVQLELSNVDAVVS